MIPVSEKSQAPTKVARTFIVVRSLTIRRCERGVHCPETARWTVTITDSEKIVTDSIDVPMMRKMSSTASGPTKSESFFGTNGPTTDAIPVASSARAAMATVRAQSFSLRPRSARISRKSRRRIVPSSSATDLTCRFST